MKKGKLREVTDLTKVRELGNCTNGLKSKDFHPKSNIISATIDNNC